jgi:hypothetical protein
MLAHSPALPLVIDYSDKVRDITAEGKEGIILALEQRDRLSLPRPSRDAFSKSAEVNYGHR